MLVVNEFYGVRILSQKQGFYYGWVIAVASMTMLWVTNGMVFGGLTVFDEELLGMLGRATGEENLLGQLKFRDAITLIVGGMMAPLAGAIADRVGVRPLMIFGLLLLAVGNFLYSQVSGFSEIYFIHLLLAASIASAGLVVNVIIVSRWFVKHRGTAMGIAVAGSSLGNATIPQLNAWLISEFGWQTAFVYGSAMPLLLIPMVLFVIRENPQDRDRELSDRTGKASGGSPLAMHSKSFSEAIRTPAFWMLALIAMSTFYAVLAIMAHLFLHMRGQGFEIQMAATGLGVMFSLGLVGKIGSGFLSDRYGRKPVLLGTLSIMAIGAILLVNTSMLTFWPALVLFGLGWGGLYTLLQVLAGDLFGVRDLGKILGTITILDSFGGGMGPFLTGVMFDRFQSYTIPFAVIAGLVCFALFLATRLQIKPLSGKE